MQRKKSTKWIWIAGLTLLLLVMAVGAMGGSDGEAANVGSNTESTSTSTGSNTSPPTTPQPGSTDSTESAGSPTTATTATSATTGAGDPVSQLAIAPESHDETYDRTLFPHWLDLDRDGCDTRCEVLESEKLAGGGWLSSYDGLIVQSPHKLDIDHLVPLAEAWRSGAWAWATPKRALFANDLDEPASLAAVTAGSNRSKGDGDPASWRPQPSEWCTYARSWIKVKLRWELTADPAEAQALRQMLSTC